MYRLSIYVAIGLSMGCSIGLGIMPFWLGLVIAIGLGLATASRPIIVALIALPIAVSIGLGRTALIPTPTTFKLSPNTKAIIDDFPRFLGDTAYIAAHGGPKNHRLLLKFYGPPPTYGDTITFTGHQQHRPPATNPGQPDPASWSQTQRIVGPITVDDYTVTDHDFRNPIKRIAHVFRNRIVTTVNMALPPPYGDLLIALTLGDSGTSIPEDLTTAYQTAGLTHLLVVSGSQVSLIIGIGTSVISMLALPTLPRIGVLTLLNVFFYCLCGGGASILRAVIMSELSVVTQAFKNPTPPLQLIGVTIIIFVLIDPTLVANIGAHLSFLATAALVWGVPSLAQIFPTHWPDKLRTVLAMSLAPFLMTFPVMWAQFHSISVVSLIANIMVTPLIEVVVVVGMAAEIVTLIVPPIGIWGLSACHAITIFINGIATTAAKVPHALVHLAHPPIIVVSAVMIGIVTTLIQELIPNRTIKIAVLVGCSAIFIGYTVMTATSQQPLRIVAIDVDQGDSTLIMTPGGKTILIDAGNHIVSHRTGRTVFNAGKERVVPLLNYYGIDQLDWVIITHFDQDHIGGIPAILQKIPVKALYTNGHHYLHPQWQFPSQIHIESPEERTFEIEPGIRLQLITIKSDEVTKENDHSIVARLEYGHFSALFTGDLETVGEDIVANAFGSDLESDLLKLGHHGSKTSTSEYFLTCVHPKVALISAGRDNKYGHPHPSVLDRIQRHHIPSWGTYEKGAIIIETDGKLGWIRGWKDDEVGFNI